MQETRATTIVDEKEKKEITHSIVAVTGTFYKKWYPGDWIEGLNDTDKVRGDLALQTMKTALDKGYQLVVVDAGSSEEFKESAKELGIELNQQTADSMSGSRREGFIRAANLPGIKVIAWLEPEKLSLVENEKCLFEAAQLILDNLADVVVLERDEAGINSLPRYQAVSEEDADRRWSKMLRISKLLKDTDRDLKPFFGPKLFKNTPRLLSIFTTEYKIESGSEYLRGYVKPEQYSDATFFPIVEALIEGYKVLPKEVPYLHPTTQTKIESDSPAGELRRKNQKYDIVLGLAEFIKLKSGKKSLLKKIA